MRASCTSRVRLDVRITSGGVTAPDRAELRDGDGEVRQHLEQERLELVVGPVDLVDQQHAGRVLERLQQRPGQQEAPVVEGGLERRGVVVGVRRLGGAQVQQLAAEVPVVERLAGLQALVALQPVERPAGDLGQRVRQRRLADARLALEEQRAVHDQRQVGRRRQPLVGQVPGALQRGRRARRARRIPRARRRSAARWARSHPRASHPRARGRPAAASEGGAAQPDGGRDDGPMPAPTDELVLGRRPARLRRRLPLPRPRGGRARPPARGRRLHRARRDRLLGCPRPGPATTSSATAAWSPSGWAAGRCRTPGCASSAPTPTPPRSRCARTPTSARPDTGWWASSRTAAGSGTPGWTAS